MAELKNQSQRYKGIENISWVVPLDFSETRETAKMLKCPCLNRLKGQIRAAADPRLENGKNTENTFAQMP